MFSAIVFQPAICQEKIFLNNIQEKTIDQAIVVLPGFGDSTKGRRKQLAFFSRFSHDVYIPDYTNKKSYDGCVSNFQEFVKKHELANYQELHFFTYILGSWVLNETLKTTTMDNISTIIYDRSPLQERAPAVAHGTIPRITRLMKGPVVGQMSRISYQPIAKGDIRVGIIIESRATPLISKFRKQTLALGEVEWSPDSLKQAHDDYFFTWLNHNQMYTRFDVIGDEISNFLLEGRFSDQARREMYIGDPFKKYKQK